MTPVKHNLTPIPLSLSHISSGLFLISWLHFVKRHKNAHYKTRVSLQGDQGCLPFSHIYKIHIPFAVYTYTAASFSVITDWYGFEQIVQTYIVYSAEWTSMNSTFKLFYCYASWLNVDIDWIWTNGKQLFVLNVC